MAKVKNGDTLRLARAEIAKRIMASPLFSALGESYQRALEMMATSQADYSAWSFLSLEFRKAGSNCNLYGETSSDWDRDTALTDDAGNEYTEHKLTFKINWPSHGSTDAGVCLARAEFFKQVAILACELQGEFGDTFYHKLYRTKEQREKQEAEALARRIEEDVRAAISQVRKGLRRGGVATPAHELLNRNVPQGKYKHTFPDGKTYELFVERKDHEGISLVSYAMVTRTE